MSVSDWADMLNQTVTYKALSSRDSYGAPTYGAATSYDARVVYKSKFLRKSDGADVMATGAVWLQGAPAVSPEGLLTLPDGTTPPILSVERFPDETDAYHHTKVYFG